MTTALKSNTEVCPKCGLTLFIQEHHTSYNPEITENMCVLCHADKHPGKRNLILASALRSRNRSRWDTPLHILAGRAGVSSAAIVLRAQRHNIQGGILSEDQERILSEPSRYKKRETQAEKLEAKAAEIETRFFHIVDKYKDVPRHYSSHNKTTIEMSIEKVRGLLRGERVGSFVFCRQCGYIWKRKVWHPVACPRCFSQDWSKSMEEPNGTKN